MSKKDVLASRHRLRRHIQIALTGAVLGAGLIAVPAYAATYTVTTTADVVDADDGLLSLREAINGANADPGSTVSIDASDPAIGANPVFAINSPLPALTNGTTVNTTGGITSLELPSALTTNGVGNAGYKLHNSNITGSITAINGGNFDFTDSSITGNALADGYNSSLAWYSEIELANSTLIGNVTTDNGGFFYLRDGSSISGDVTINSDSENYLYDSNITGAVTTNNNSSIRLNDSSITGDVTLNHDSYIELDDESSINGNVTTNYYSELELNDDSFITGNVTLNDNSDIYLNESSISGNVTTNHDSYIELDESFISGNVTLHHDSDIELYDQSSISGNVILNHDSEIYLDDSSITSGTAGDAVTTHDNAELHIHYGSLIDTDVTLNDNSYLHMTDGSDINGFTEANGTSHIFLEDSYINGNVELNDYSLLRNQGISELNDGSGTTTFGSNATFAPDVYSAFYDGPLTVDSLTLSDSTLRPWFSDTVTSLPIGSAMVNNIAVIDYNSVSGTFNPVALSPFDVGVANTTTGNNSGSVVVFLNSNEINFNRLPGSDNASSMGRFFNDYINDSQTDPNVLDITALPDYVGGDFYQITSAALEALDETSYAGNLSVFDEYIQEGGLLTYSALNTQAYWNQKSFVEVIKANVNNSGNMSGSNPNTFALNQATTINTAPMQLASLRQAMAPSSNRLNLDGNNGSSGQGVWASYSGNHQSTDGDSGIGSTPWSSSSDAFTLGYTSGGDRFSWGVAAGHQKSDLRFDYMGDVGKQDGWNAGLYGSLKGKSAYLTGILSHGRYDNETQDGIGQSNFKNKVTSISLEVGKHLSNKKSGGFTPYASVLWSKIKQDGAIVQSSGGGSGIGDLILKGNSNNVFTTELGLRYNHRMFDKNDVLKGGWQAGLAWLHQGGDKGMSSTFAVNGVPGSFGIQGTPLDGNSLVVRLVAYGRIHNNLIGFAGYQGTFGSDQKINGVNAGIGYQF